MKARFALLVACVFVSAAPLAAQSTAGTITGIVSDQTGGVLPSAQIVVTNQGTGFERQTITNAAGEYRVPLIPPGVYSIRVEASGFKVQVNPSVKLEMLQTARVDFKLELGDVREVVTVEAGTPLLETEQTTTGTVIKSEQVTNLPLNVRQFMQMVFLSPFAIPASRDFRSTEVARDTAVPSGGGARPEDNNYQVDGFDNQESGRHGFALSPPIDSIAEFKVQAGTAPADFGRGSGTMINVVTKGGSNDFHGSLYEFLRNDLFDARNFFAASKSPLKRNQFGAALGGPILKNKLLFFANFEGFRQRSAGAPRIGRVPTADERNGLFTTAVRDPLTGVTFPQVGGKWQIPSNRFSPISVKILDLWPIPNTNDVPARNFRYEPGSAPSDKDYLTFRGDYNPSTADTLYVRYVRNKENSETPPNFPNGAGGRKFLLGAWTTGGHYDHVFSPRMVNQFGFGYMHYDNTNLAFLSNGTNYHQQVGILNVLAYDNPIFTGTPSISVAGYLGPGEATPNYRTTNNYEFTDTLSWQRGKHGFKFGGDFRVIDTDMFYTGGNGSHGFANAYSGDNFADFMLGLPSSLSKTARATLWSSRLYYGAFFFHDDWKVTPKLTVNFGLRYELESALQTPRNDTLGWDEKAGEMLVSQNIANRARIEDFYKNIRPDIKIRFVPQDVAYDADTNNLAPRIGLAYQLHGSTVLRMGFGMFYNAPQAPSLASTNDFAPNTLRPIWTGHSTRPVIVYPNGTEGPTGYNPEGTGGPEATVAYPSPLTIFPFYSRSFPYGLNYQWMMSLQRQLTRSFVLEGQYLGSRTNRLLGFHNTNYTTPAPGSPQARLPFPSFARIQGEHMGLDAWYQGFGLKGEQRLTHGVSYLASYTWSKALDTGSTLNQSPVFTNPANLWGSARGPSDFDARHRFVVSFGYELPVGKGRQFAASAPAIVDHIIGGWGVRGITFFQSGFGYSPGMNLARANYCAVACIANADRIASGNLPKDQRTLDRYYDITAFVLPPLTAPRAGNGGRNILVGPGLNNWDLGVFKQFRIAEGKKLEFRYEMFNAGNHPQWGAPSSSVEVPATFGRVTSARDPRISQFVLKLTF